MLNVAIATHRSRKQLLTSTSGNCFLYQLSIDLFELELRYFVPVTAVMMSIWYQWMKKRKRNFQSWHVDMWSVPNAFTCVDLCYCFYLYSYRHFISNVYKTICTKLDIRLVKGMNLQLYSYELKWASSVYSHRFVKSYMKSDWFWIVERVNLDWKFLDGFEVCSCLPHWLSGHCWAKWSSPHRVTL